MKVLTELDLRTNLKKMGQITAYKVPSGTILTPAARSFLSENKIDIIFSNDDEKGQREDKQDITQDYSVSNNKVSKNKRYFLIEAGVRIDEKPEAYTHLYANNLVPKYHPRIKLRGKIDSLEAHIIITQTKAKKRKMENMVKDLEDILTLARNILRAEVLSETLEEFTLIGLTEQEIREISHNPKKTLGIPHFMPTHEMGEMMAELNLVRTQVRETELAAVEAFFNPTKGLQREDIVKALNRMSSAVYVIMCRLKAGKYENQGFKL
ncbi:MAG: cobalamin adenosyltransferase [Tepidanaerobacteraceae bacterium]